MICFEQKDSSVLSNQCAAEKLQCKQIDLKEKKGFKELKISDAFF